MALVAIASLLLLLGSFAVWAKRQLLETDTWTDTSTKMLEDPAIQEALADFLVVELYDNVDVEAQLAAKLPPQLQPLAGPVAGGLRQLADQVATKALAQPQTQELWEEANRKAHSQFIAIIDDETTAGSTEGGTVTLELGTILNSIAAQLGISADVASKLPPDAGSLEIMQSDQLEGAQTAVDLLRSLALVLAALVLIAYALAIYLAGDRRRETLRAVGFSFFIVGALILALHRVAGDAIVSSLSEVASADDAVAAVWTIGTSQLTDIGSSLVIYGIFFVLAAWLAGPTPIPTSIRSAIAPRFRQPAYAYGTLVVVLIVLFWWDPVVATHRLVPSLLLILLLALGFEFLRRQVIREFPDRVTTTSGDGIAQRIAARIAP